MIEIVVTIIFPNMVIYAGGSNNNTLFFDKPLVRMITTSFLVKKNYDNFVVSLLIT